MRHSRSLALIAVEDMMSSIFFDHAMNFSLGKNILNFIESIVQPNISFEVDSWPSPISFLMDIAGSLRIGSSFAMGLKTV